MASAGPQRTFPLPAELKYLHDAVESRLEAAQILLLHLDLLQDLLLAGQALLVLLCQPRGENSVTATATKPARAQLGLQLSRPDKSHCRNQKSSETVTNKELLTPRATGGRKEPIRAGKQTGRESGSSASCCAQRRDSNWIFLQICSHASLCCQKPR